MCHSFYLPSEERGVVLLSEERGVPRRNENKVMNR